MIQQTGPQRWRVQDPMGPLWLLVIGAAGAGGVGVYALGYGLTRARHGLWDAESLLTGSALVGVAVILAAVVAWLRAFPARQLRIDGARREVSVWRRRERLRVLSFEEALPVRVERIAPKTNDQNPAYWVVKLRGCDQHVYWATSDSEAEVARARLQALLSSAEDGPGQEDR